MRPQRPLKLRMRSQHPFGGRGCSYRSVGGEGGLMRPQRPLMLRMRSQHPFGGRGCSYRSVGEGGARTGLLGEGADAPPASTQVAHALSASFWGKGLLVPVCWGRVLMRPQRPLMLRMRPQHPFGGRGPQVWGKEFYKRGVSSILFLSCSAIILSTQIILQVCDL